MTGPEVRMEDPQHTTRGEIYVRTTHTYTGSPDIKSKKPQNTTSGPAPPIANIAYTNASAATIVDVEDSMRRRSRRPMMNTASEQNAYGTSVLSVDRRMMKVNRSTSDRE